MSNETDRTVRFFGPNFHGVTRSSMAVLNARLKTQNRPEIHTLEELKKSTAGGAYAGIFRLTKQNAGGKQQTARLISVVDQKAFLSESGVVGISNLTLTSNPSLSDLCEKAVALTTAIVEGRSVPAEKSRARPLKEEEGPVFSTACGETFDPGRCSLMSSSPYAQQKVEEFLERFQIYKSKDAKYESMCDLLKAHWTKYMTDSLLDVFGHTQVTLSNTELKNMAIERGIPIDGKSDQEIANDLIRFMIERLLLLDASHLGLGDASGRIVSMLMEGSLDLTTLTEKQKLAVLMIGARFNKKLLNFVVVGDNDDMKFEFENFQQSLSNLRTAVKNLKGTHSVKIATGVAETIAKTEKKQEEQEVTTMAKEAHSPVQTLSRMASDYEVSISKLEMTSKRKTFKHMAYVLKETQYLHRHLRGGAVVRHMFLITDDSLESILKKHLGGMSVEKFARLPIMNDLLETVTFISPHDMLSSVKAYISTGRDFGNIRGESFHAALSSDEQILTLTHVPSGGSVKVSMDYKEPSNFGKLRVYATTGLMAGAFMKQLLSYVNQKSPPVERKKSPPVATVQPKKETKVVDVDLPSVVPPVAKTPLTPCQQLVSQFKTKSVNKIGLMLFGDHGLLRSDKDSDPEELRDLEVLRRKVQNSKALEGEISSGLLDLVHQILVVFKRESNVNPNFDVQINLKDSNSSCRAITDLVKGHTKAVPPKPKVKTPEVPKKPQFIEDDDELEPSDEESSGRSFAALSLALIELDCSNLETLIESASENNILQGLMEETKVENLTVFVPNDIVMTSVFTRNGFDFDTLLENEDAVENFLGSLIAYSSASLGSKLKTVVGLEREVEGELYKFAGRGTIVMVDDFDLTPELFQLLDIEAPKTSRPASSSKPKPTPVEVEEELEPSDEEPQTIPEKDCERIEFLMSLMESQPTNMQQAFGNLKTLVDLDIESAKVMLADIFSTTTRRSMDYFLGIFNDHFTRYFHETVVGYFATEAAAKKLPFSCSSIERLHLAGHSKVVANVQSKVAQTPAVPTPSKVQDETRNTLMKAIASRAELSETLFWLEITGVHKLVEDGAIKTLFAPDNQAWDDFYKSVNVTKQMLVEKRLKAMVGFLELHASPNLVHLEHEVEVQSLYKGENVHASNDHFGDSKIVSQEHQVGLYVISKVQTAESVKKSRHEKRNSPPPVVSDIRTGEKVKGTSPLTQTKQFQHDVSKLNKKTPQAEPLKDTTLMELLDRGDFKIMRMLVQKVPVENGKTLLQMGGSFTLFVPQDQAFADEVGATIEDAIAVTEVELEDPDSSSKLLRHHLILNRVLDKKDLEKLAKGPKLRMADGEDEDIDVRGDQLFFRHDAKDKLISTTKIQEGIVHVTNIVLRPLQPQEEDIELMGEDEELEPEEEM